MIINITGDARDQIAFNVEFSKFILKSHEFHNDFPNVGSYRSEERHPQGFDIVKMLHSMSPERLREAVLYYYENHVMDSEFKQPYYGRYDTDRNHQSIKTYRVSYPLTLAHYLEDEEMTRRVIRHLLDNPKYEPLFHWSQRMIANSRTLFMHAPKELQKEVFLRVKKNIWASEKHTKLRKLAFGDFVCSLISVFDGVSLNQYRDRKRAYEDFFAENFTLKERAELLDLMEGQLGSVKKTEYWEILLSAKKIHPTCTQRFEASFRDAIENQSYNNIDRAHYLQFATKNLLNEYRELVKAKIIKEYPKSLDEMVRNPFPADNNFNYSIKLDEDFINAILIKICRSAIRKKLSAGWVKKNVMKWHDAKSSQKKLNEKIDHYMLRYINIAENDEPWQE